ncbi:dipeptidase [Pelagovum pacificum]|nr:dipeptidase [Pelagovum pacificum]QQA41298.1 dipeptidase [Pelagovum pacificum]
MTTTDLTPVFDGHNDALLRLASAARAGEPIDFVTGDASLQVDLPKAEEGGLRGGMFALFAPNSGKFDVSGGLSSMPAFPPITRDEATPWMEEMIALADDLVARSSGRVRKCTTAADLAAAESQDQLAMVLHIEGAEALSPDLSDFDRWCDLGVRSIGPVWSRPNAFAEGVPFAFPGDPDVGGGLSDAGKQLLAAMDERGMIFDLSHLNAAGVRDVAKLSRLPLVATHSAVHEICPSPRNLTDEQLRMIADSGGLVGLNFHVGFLRTDGAVGGLQLDLAELVRHLDHLLAFLGEEGVALGSDYDGGVPPGDIASAARLQALPAALREAGYSEDLIERICWRNWRSMLARVWGN